MSLPPSIWSKLATLSLLYFVQGAPYGFQSSSLPLVLRRDGLSFTQLGAMKLLYLPWICKPLYAPLVDNTRSKKFWLAGTIGCLGLTCFFAGRFVAADNLIGLSSILLLMNLLCSAQDISVDGLAVRTLNTDEEVGWGNTVQVVAYKAGSIFAGGILLLLQDRFGWAWMFYIFGSSYLLCAFLVIRLDLGRPQHSFEGAKEEEESFADVVKDAMATPGTAKMIGFVLFYKLCERAEQTFSLYLVDKGVSATRLGGWSTVMKTSSLLGSAYGGYAISRGSRPIALIDRYALRRALAIAAQYAVVVAWGHGRMKTDELDVLLMNSSFLLLCAVLFCAGVITTATFSLMMAFSQTAEKHSTMGTHYSTLATFEVFGKICFAAVSGFLLDNVGFHATYFSFVILAFLTVPFVWWLPEPSKNNNAP